MVHTLSIVLFSDAERLEPVLIISRRNIKIKGGIARNLLRVYGYQPELDPETTAYSTPPNPAEMQNAARLTLGKPSACITLPHVPEAARGRSTRGVEIVATSRVLPTNTPEEHL